MHLLYIEITVLVPFGLSEQKMLYSTSNLKLYLGTSLIEKLQIHRFINPLQVVSFQLEYLGQIPLVVSFSKSKKNMQNLTTGT